MPNSYKKNNAKRVIDQKQSAQIRTLLSLVRPQKKKTKSKRPQMTRGVKNTAVALGDPIVTAIKASFRPFEAEKGIAAPLSDGRPAQKFMAKAQSQITLTSGQMMAFMFCPNCASNSTNASVVVAVGAATGGQFSYNSAWKNASTGDLVGAWGSILRVSTNTPYTSATLFDQGLEYACVGAGLKFTYEGSELYRGGTMRYIFDTESGYNIEEDWTVDTVNGLIDYINSSPNTVRQSINDSSVVEINGSLLNRPYIEANSSFNTCYGTRGNKATSLGGASATTNFGISPPIIGYYVNTSGNSISFHLDVVEHWSISGATIQSLQTPSYAHAAMGTHVAAVMANVRQAHAGTPNTTHASVAQDTLKVMKSPIGHELLNVGIRAALA